MEGSYRDDVEYKPQKNTRRINWQRTWKMSWKLGYIRVRRGSALRGSGHVVSGLQRRLEAGQPQLGNLRPPSSPTCEVHLRLRGGVGGVDPVIFAHITLGKKRILFT